MCLPCLAGSLLAMLPTVLSSPHMPDPNFPFNLTEVGLKVFLWNSGERHQRPSVLFRILMTLAAAIFMVVKQLDTRLYWGTPSFTHPNLYAVTVLRVRELNQSPLSWYDVAHFEIGQRISKIGEEVWLTEKFCFSELATVHVDGECRMNGFWSFSFVAKYLSKFVMSQAASHFTAVTRKNSQKQ